MASHKLIQRPALLPFSLFYGLAVLIRNMLFDFKILKSKKFKIPLISVGNITVGGTGKTPHVEYIVQQLKSDFNIAVLSRGYKRKTSDFILASKKSGIRDIGDEPLQIKLKFPGIHVAVENNRVIGVKKLIKSIPKLDAVILDDAYQHRYIRPGLSILLVDYNRPIFRDMLLPAGNLREFRYNINRAGIIIVTKCPETLTMEERDIFIKKLHPGPKQEVYFTRYEYGSPMPVFPGKQALEEELSYDILHKSGSGIMLVTGIANPAPLKLFLNNIVSIREEMAFPDHYYFKSEDIRTIKRVFNTIEAKQKYIFVTEKDAVRIRESDFGEKNFQKVFYYIPIEVKFLDRDEKPFNKRLQKYLKKAH
jgi:tetraacyldisaccharide 4'-kinase